VAILVARNEAVVVPMVGTGEVCVWQEFGFRSLEDAFTLLDFIKRLYNICTFNEICKNNAEINCITVQHEKDHSRQL
jgi:hypothetical protein